MPHQNTDSATATAQNAATDPAAPNDQARSTAAEPRSYAAADQADASLAPPAAGEIADDMDEGEALGEDDVQSGRDRTNIGAHSRDPAHQGSKTIQANRERLKGG